MECFTSYYKNIDQDFEKKPNYDRSILPEYNLYNYRFKFDNYSKEKNIFKMLCLISGIILEGYIYTFDSKNCYGIGLGFGFLSAVLLF